MEELPVPKELVSKAVRQAFTMLVDPHKHAWAQNVCLLPGAAISLNLSEHG